MARAITLALVAAVFMAIPADAASPVSATSARTCGGTVHAQKKGNEGIVDITLVARSIRAKGFSCRAGKRVIRRFFNRVLDDPDRQGCEGVYSEKGCKVRRFRCWSRFEEIDRGRFRSSFIEHGRCEREGRVVRFIWDRHAGSGDPRG